MGDMTNRIAMWLYQREVAGQGDAAPWSDVTDDRKAALQSAAIDLLQTIRRPSLAMRIRGRSIGGGDEAEVWRAMVDGAIQDKG